MDNTSGTTLLLWKPVLVWYRLPRAARQQCILPSISIMQILNWKKHLMLLRFRAVQLKFAEHANCLRSLLSSFYQLSVKIPQCHYRNHFTIWKAVRITCLLALIRSGSEQRIPKLLCLITQTRPDAQCPYTGTRPQACARLGASRPPQCGCRAGAWMPLHAAACRASCSRGETGGTTRASLVHGEASYFIKAVL